MDRQGLEQTIRLAQKGDLCARDELIRNHRDFIAKTSSRACNRYLTWDNDELSVALIAFNEAVDKFSPDEGAAFQTFAQRVIRNRLVDYFRKESKHRHLSLSPMDPDDEELSRLGGAHRRLDRRHEARQRGGCEDDRLVAGHE